MGVDGRPKKPNHHVPSAMGKPLKLEGPEHAGPVLNQSLKVVTLTCSCIKVMSLNTDGSEQDTTMTSFTLETRRARNFSIRI